jgi:hypothetical protein
MAGSLAEGGAAGAGSRGTVDMEIIISDEIVRDDDGIGTTLRAGAF